MKHLTFLTQGGADLPSVRFRVLPYVERGQASGRDIAWHRIPKNPFARLYLFLGLPKSHAVILQKKLLSPFYLSVLNRKCKRLLYDFDDAVWMPHSALLKQRGGHQASPKNRNRFTYICRYADGVIAGNAFLAEKARRYNSRVTVLPTPIDTEQYTPGTDRESDGRFVVGWMGTAANQFYLNDLMDELRQLGDDVKLNIVSNKIQDHLDRPPIRFNRWSPEKEVQQLNRFTLGLMPLTDDEYSRGKCGFKLLQYMACGVVPLASAVGFNNEIIAHGKDGFLIRNKGEWLKYITVLKKNPALLSKMARLAREKVALKFSLNIAADTLWQILETGDER